MATRSVIAVSNSAWLRGRGLGQAIDSHDVVIRFNGAKTAGAEHDLGSRTTILATSPPIFETELTPTKWLLYVPRHLPLPSQPGPWETIPVAVQTTLTREMRLRPSRNFDPGEFPTTGLAAVFFLLQEFDVITLAGWHRGDFANPDSLKGWWDYYHPQGMEFSSKKATYHNRQAEADFVAKLVEDGRLKHLA